MLCSAPNELITNSLSLCVCVCVKVTATLVSVCMRHMIGLTDNTLQDTHTHTHTNVLISFGQV